MCRCGGVVIAIKDEVAVGEDGMGINGVGIDGVVIDGLGEGAVGWEGGEKAPSSKGIAFNLATKAALPLAGSH